MKYVMRSHLRFPLLLSATFLVGACSRAPARTADDRARQLSTLAISQRQQELFRKAAEDHTARGLEALAPQSTRVPSTAKPSIDQPIPQKPSPFPPGVISAVRLNRRPRGLSTYNGRATVALTTGEFVDLDLGQQGTMSVQARWDGQPLRVAKGDIVQVEYAFNGDPRSGREIFALRTPAGGGIVTIAESGDKPLTVKVGLFGLTASQVSPSKGNAMDVRVRVGQSERVVGQGATERFANFAVILLASTEQLTGAPGGHPYAFELVAWPTTP